MDKSFFYWLRRLVRNELCRRRHWIVLALTNIMRNVTVTATRVVPNKQRQAIFWLSFRSSYVSKLHMTINHGA